MEQSVPHSEKVVKSEGESSVATNGSVSKNKEVKPTPQTIKPGMLIFRKAISG